MSDKKTCFALIGAAGYIAPRHMKAIKESGNDLVAAHDPMDSVGIIDSYFPNADFFIEPERFDRHLDKLKRSGNKKVDYVSICSPNYLHDAHIRMALRSGAHAICEKPLVLNPWNLEGLKELEKESNKRIYNILQLRHHKSIIDLKQKIDSLPKDKVHDIDLTYITSRGKWYHYSWKGNISKSGGVVTNIGIHFFDMLGWIFGNMKSNTLHLLTADKASGLLQLENANIRWYLSIDKNDLPIEATSNDLSTYRSISVDGDDFEFSGGFTDLHTESYKSILKGKGFGLDDARNSIEIAHLIRNQAITTNKSDAHPLLSNE
ncbi:MAG: Gfo/Idh/MocA family oxidoreductase [Lentimicrobiaceae bacterium]|jgi:UDP-N-acetyl-2-amino-2-deoxyglucuronate dehydrogenase|nr:Gfo/Idh/MocA family oxidoreductase [Lentimicrobiaceae bacterium]MBT6672828.1 Gfo/Idh/MocA family oxidoreductase [Lentimicrobiaceae bacterium]